MGQLELGALLSSSPIQSASPRIPEHQRKASAGQKRKVGEHQRERERRRERERERESRGGKEKWAEHMKA